MSLSSISLQPYATLQHKQPLVIVRGKRFSYQLRSCFYNKGEWKQLNPYQIMACAAAKGGTWVNGR